MKLPEGIEVRRDLGDGEDIAVKFEPDMEKRGGMVFITGRFKDFGKYLKKLIRKIRSV